MINAYFQFCPYCSEKLVGVDRPSCPHCKNVFTGREAQLAGPATCAQFAELNYYMKHFVGMFADFLAVMRETRDVLEKTGRKKAVSETKFEDRVKEVAEAVKKE